MEDRKYERIHLDKEKVIYAITHTKNRKELSEMCNCGVNKIIDFIRENNLYKYYCEQRNIKYDSDKDLHACEICGSIHGVHRLNGIYYCKKHYNHMYRFGKIIDHTIYTPNEFIFEDDICKIVIRDKNQEINGYCIIDTEDYDKIKDLKWYITNGYCVTKGIDKNNSIDISNVIFNTVGKEMYDHQNHDRLDNRKINLRSVTSHQNAINMGKKITNTSGVTGVQLQSPCHNRWQATLMYNYKVVWLGSYVAFNEAVVARLKGEIDYFKEYSPNYAMDEGIYKLKFISKDDNETYMLKMDKNKNILLFKKIS